MYLFTYVCMFVCLFRLHARVLTASVRSVCGLPTAEAAPDTRTWRLDLGAEL